jgi:hypothetical protein
MFSLERCREVLGVSDLDELELQHLRYQLYGLAEVITDEITREIRENHPSHKNGFKTALRMLDPAKREEVEERAAIIEFDGGDSRDESLYEPFLGTN